MILVTKTFFPPIEEYQFQLKRIWANQWLTNRGELTLELEEKLKNYLHVNNLTLMNNGTIPLQIILKLVGNGGEVITTPFSYVATTSSIIWENCTPIFVDIEPNYFTIDPTKIEAAITKKTTCILATHVYGNPCNIGAIEEIAKKYNLYVIYDAAHCFGVEYNKQSIFNYGDFSTCSFHATKLFHTGEGGALFCNNKNYIHPSFYSHNFGHNGQEAFFGLGINGKISELQAAMGLAVFPYINKIIEKRKKMVEYYNANLSPTIQKLKIRENTTWNYAYYPIVFNTAQTRIEIVAFLNKENIFPRRYFYPSLNTLPYINSIKMPIAEEVSNKIICLPLYESLEMENVKNICKIINKNI